MKYVFSHSLVVRQYTHQGYTEHLLIETRQAGHVSAGCTSSSEVYEYLVGNLGVRRRW